MRRTLLQLTARIPATPAGMLSAVAGGPHDLWEPRDGGRQVCAAGVVRRLDARGPERFARIAAAAEALWPTVEDAREPGADEAPAPLLLGGLAFAPARVRRTAAAPWQGFADASFVLPSAALLTEGARSWLRVVVPAADGLAEARRRLAALAGRLADRARWATPRSDRSSGAVPVQIEHMRPGAWRSLVADALRRLQRHEVDKVVAARCSVVSAGAPIDVAATLARLRGPGTPGLEPGVLFSFERAGATFLGRSPERLVALAGRRVQADALAGTGADPAELAASGKDHVEHAIVIDAIRRVLAPLTADLQAPAVPLVRTLPGLCHLWTPVTATLTRPAHVLDLVQLLHPTPAVAGTPVAAALAWIASHEPASRGWYAGPVGWFDAHGDGDFAVAIRSGLIRGPQAWIWAGAGIVPASDPDREYDETRVKQGALLGALGVWP